MHTVDDHDKTVNFQKYLESKVQVDFKSMNRQVFATFKRLVRRMKDPTFLDVGTGTGLMIRRLLSLNLRGEVSLYGIDPDNKSCETALRSIREELESSDCPVAWEGIDPGLGLASYTLRAVKGRTSLQITIINADFFIDATLTALREIGFHCITANAFMDIVPLNEGVQRIYDLLIEKGVFYSTINYDGLTLLLPLYSRQEIETGILNSYNRSMDTRKIDGKCTGGSRTGSKIYDAVQQTGFSVKNFGSSDWQIFPRGGKYSPGERLFLSSILTMIYSESRENPTIDKKSLEAWYKTRINEIHENRLVLLTHQTDIVAVKERKGINAALSLLHSAAGGDML